MLALSRFTAACLAHPGKVLLAGLGLVCVLALALADRLLAEPVRSWAERTLNANLRGYTVRIARARPHLWRLGLDLDSLVLVQDSHPEPPVADFEAMEFSLDWGPLLHFKWAGDLTLRRPALHINLPQIQEAATSKVRLRDRGWQRAVEAIYPIKLDRVKVEDGSLLYLSGTPTSKPLQLTRVAMVAANVRNIAAAKGTYPSPVSLEAAVFDTGHVQFKGAADFLREPNPAATGEIQLTRVPLDRLTPLAQSYQLKTTGGMLSAKGTVEYTPESQTAHLTQVLFEQLRVDYVTSSATRALETLHGQQALALAKRVRNAPSLLLQVDTLRLTQSQIGFENQTANPPYRLFMTNVDMELANLSNQTRQGSSTFKTQGSFMGSGTTQISGGIQSTAHPVDMTLRLQLDGARLTDLNPFLLANVGVDVAAGEFSAFTELKVAKGRMEGYLKVLATDLKIYERGKDHAKPFGKRVEMHVLQSMAWLFKNRSTQQVATETRISGATSDPKIGEWEAIRRLIGNGMVQGILPGFRNRSQAKAPPKPGHQPGPDAAQAEASGAVPRH